MKNEKNFESLEKVKSRMKVEQSLFELNGERVTGASSHNNQRVTELISDSRRVTPGSAFFALPGMRTDGTKYIQEALERGAKTIVTQDPSLEVPNSVAKICVEDARRTLAKFAKRYYGNPDEHLDLIGVTGTNGKTTVTTLTRHLLEDSGRPVGLIGTVRYHLGDREIPSFRTTPESTDLYSLLRNMVVGGCSEAVMEVSSHGIHQSRVSGLRLGVTVFLNLTRDHLDYHETMEHYFNEKRKIFNGVNGKLPKVAVINGDCIYGKRLMNEPVSYTHLTLPTIYSV